MSGLGLRERQDMGYRPMRGERRARWFIREWQKIGGGFAFAQNDLGKDELGLIPPANWADLPQDDKVLALFCVGYPGCYKVAAKIVREEGLAA